VPEHTIAEGDCIVSLAEANGLLWQSIWDHPSNAELKAKREDPNILLPGDILFIPEKRIKEQQKGTDQTHKFVRLGTPAKVRLRLLDFERKPRKNVRYVATVDDNRTEGTSDADGMIEFYAKPTAREVHLILTENGRREEHRLQLGHMDPADSLSGVQRRLHNLGYDCGGEDGTLGDATRAALRAFQQERELPITGEADDATQSALRELHGS
jgi:hypothetical protein